MNQLGASIDAMVDSYITYGLVNHGAGKLPSRESIAAILMDVENLIFPGFSEDEEEALSCAAAFGSAAFSAASAAGTAYGVALSREDLRLLTAERVHSLARRLVREVERSLAFAARGERRRAALNAAVRPPLPEKGGNAASVNSGSSASGEASDSDSFALPCDPANFDLDETAPPPAPASAGLADGKREDCRATARRIVDGFFMSLPDIRLTLADDLAASFRGDPAAKSVEEVIVSYPGFEAVIAHRLAHYFWRAGVPIIPRMISELVHGRTGIDIHPGAEIGASFFIDHGTGVVIGETCVIGRGVKMYQGVTLGALSVRKVDGNRKRHPTLEDNVTIYANATILGGETIIGEGSTIGGNVWLTESVPPRTIVYAKSGELSFRYE